MPRVTKASPYSVNLLVRNLFPSHNSSSLLTLSNHSTVTVSAAGIFFFPFSSASGVSSNRRNTYPHLLCAARWELGDGHAVAGDGHASRTQCLTHDNKLQLILGSRDNSGFIQLGKCTAPSPYMPRCAVNRKNPECRASISELSRIVLRMSVPRLHVASPDAAKMRCSHLWDTSGLHSFYL